MLELNLLLAWEYCCLSSLPVVGDVSRERLHQWWRGMKCGCIGRLTLVSRCRVRSFDMIRIRIGDPRSFGSWWIKWTHESLSRVDSSVHLIYHDPSDLGSLIPIWIIPKERTHRVFSHDVTAAILVFQNNETAAMLVSKPVLWELNILLM